MPQGNLEIVREMYERREAGDMYVGEFVDPELVSSESVPKPPTSRGNGMGWTA